MGHFKNLVSQDVRAWLYKAFILPYYFFSTVVPSVIFVEDTIVANWNHMYLTNKQCD